MKTLNKVKLKYALPILLLVTATLLLINSCKKNLSDASTDTKVLQAKTWYEATFPQTSNTQTNLSVQSVGARSARTDFSQLLKPDWEHNSSYRRLNKDVIEMPVTLPSSIAFGLVNSLKSYNSTYTRSSFLILKDNTHYDAYVMVVVADSSYVKNDLTKLAHNTYRKHDSDFNGVVLYFTPKGDFLKSYGYKNGHIIKRPIQTGTQQVQSITNSAKKINSKDDYAAGCLIYWWVTYQYGVETSRTFMFEDCTGSGGGAAGDGGGTSDDSPCNVTTNSLNSTVKTNSYDDPGVDDPGDGGYPDPPPSTSTVCTVPVDIINNVKNLCLHSMVDDAVSKDITFVIDQSVQSIFKENTNFNLKFGDDPSNLANPNADGETGIGNKSFDNKSMPTQLTGIDLVITLNASQIGNSSKEYIAATIIHESFHAYMRANGLIMGDHQDMVRNYLDVMQADLMNMFPGLSSDDAFGLTWGGLETDAATAYNSLSDTQKIIIGNANRDYKSGAKGQACTH